MATDSATTRCPGCGAQHAVYRVETELVPLLNPRQLPEGGYETHREKVSLVPTYPLTRKDRFCDACKRNGRAKR